ncbi:MAG: hypothetical protein M1472_00285, partial [Planctomycetes bacterium]|nr:hypothetical protein [Planctomycetota bacterium]
KTSSRPALANLPFCPRKTFPSFSPPFSNIHADGEHVYCGIVREKNAKLFSTSLGNLSDSSILI